MSLTETNAWHPAVARYRAQWLSRHPGPSTWEALSTDAMAKAMDAAHRHAKTSECAEIIQDEAENGAWAWDETGAAAREMVQQADHAAMQSYHVMAEVAAQARITVAAVAAATGADDESAWSLAWWASWDWRMPRPSSN